MFRRARIVTRRMSVSALICRDDHPAIFGQSFDSFLHPAIAMSATIVASADKWEMTKDYRELDIWYRI